MPSSAVSALLTVLLSTAPGGAAPASPEAGPERWFEIEPRQILTLAGGPPPLEVGARGAAFYGVRGLALAPDGATLYLLDQARAGVFAVDLRNERVQRLAGNGIGGWNGDGHAGLDTSLHVPTDLAVDPRTGSLVIADAQNHRVRELAADGSWVRTVAGVGVQGLDPWTLPTDFPFDPDAVGSFSGDLGAALEAELNQPSGVTVGPAGHLWISDSENHRIRVVNRGTRSAVLAGVEVPPGAIATVAGTGRRGFAGDGGPALAAELALPLDLEILEGGLFFVDGLNQRIRRVDLGTGRIETVAQGSLAHLTTDQAAEAWSLSIAGLGLDGVGGLVFSDRSAHRVFGLRPGGPVRELAQVRGAVDGRSVGLGSVVANRRGLFLADVYHNRILDARRPRGSEVIAGGAPAAEGVAAARADFSILGPLTTDAAGNLYIPDAFHYSVRRIDAQNGRVTTLAGNGRLGNRGDGGAPEEAALVHPTDVRVAADGSVYIVDQYAHAVRRVVTAPQGDRIETVQSAKPPPGDDDLRAEPLLLPLAAALHPITGELFVSTQGTHSIYRITADGRAVLYAGSGVPGFAGDGGSALWARFNWPAMMVFGPEGSLYVSDLLNHRVRRIAPDRTITTVAGIGRAAWNGDGRPAAETSLCYPAGLAFGPDGGLYVADSNHHRIRRIDPQPPHRVSTVVGTGVRGFAGDGGDPLAARLNLPRGLAFGADGILYFADAFNRRIRAVRF